MTYTVTVRDEAFEVTAATPERAALRIGHRTWGLPRDMPGQPPYAPIDLCATPVETRDGTTCYAIGFRGCLVPYGHVVVHEHTP